MKIGVICYEKKDYHNDYFNINVINRFFEC